MRRYSSHANDPFADTLATDRLFSADDVRSLCEFLCAHLDGGGGLDILPRVEENRFRPSEKLMDHVAKVIKEKSEYVLLDEQLVVFERVLDCIRKGHEDRRKRVVIVQGGPGTGKSVIAINLMAELLNEERAVHYATGSRAFTTTLRGKIGSRGSSLFKYFNSYLGADPNTIDVLVADEAHRIREYSHSRWTKKTEITHEPQIDELVRAAKVGVYFIDDRQGVRPEEIGSSEMIREHALRRLRGLRELDRQHPRHRENRQRHLGPRTSTSGSCTPPRPSRRRCATSSRMATPPAWSPASVGSGRTPRTTAHSSRTS